MVTIKLDNEITVEQLFSLIASDFHRALDKQKRNAEIMNSKKFNYGDVVIKKSASRLDNMFGVNTEDIGVVVGCYEIDGINSSFGDYKKQYRVYYSSKNSYVGTDEDSIELYEGDIPEHLKNVTWNNIYYQELSV